MNQSSNQPAISIIIPAYNRENSIRDAIQSVLRQTWSDFELIIVDDCSKDGTVAAIQEINDPRIRLIRHDQNKGAGGARNTGIRAASGTWVAFQDSDDEWLPRKLDLQMRAIAAAAPETIGAYCGMFILGEAEDSSTNVGHVEYWPVAPSGTSLDGNMHKALLHGSLISTQTFMGRRETILQTDLFDTALPALEDWDFFISFSKLGRIAFCPEPLVIQRFSANSLTRSIERRVSAQVAMLKKHRADLQVFPEAMARRLTTIAGGYRQLGHPGKGIPYALDALRIKPGRLKSWLTLARLMVAVLSGK